MHTRGFACAAAGILLLTSAGRSVPQEAMGLPDSTVVMQRVVRRAAEVARTGGEDGYACVKHSVREELDASGKPVKVTEETYQMIPIDGVRFSRLILRQGRPLSASEDQEQERKEAEFRIHAVERRAEATRTANRSYLDEKVMKRFVFQVTGQAVLNHRPVIVVSFHPKPNPGPENTVTDKVLDHLAGTLWVDDGESEVARLKVGLTSEVSLGWLGVVGSLRQFDLTLERTRLTNGLWVKQKQTLTLGGRKVWSTLRYRIVDEFSDFRKP